MPTPILMPALSPTMTEGNVARWLKKEGDVIKAGQVIAEIETDKATMEVEAVDEGTLVKILVPAGTQGVAVNAPIAVLADVGESPAEALAAFGSGPSSSVAGSVASAPPPAATSAASAAPVPTAALAETQGGRVHASPLAKRLAAQAGIQLSTLQGTGPGGRIVQADVERAQTTGGVDPVGSARAVSPTFGSGPDARSLADKLGRTYTTEPVTSMRKVIARRLSESKQQVPHFYLTIECVIDELLALRQRLNAVSPVKISVNDCVIRAVALALQKVPAANASWNEDVIVRYVHSDVSVAVATPQGLITPIVKNAENKTLAEISAEMKDLGTRAREGKLRPEEFQGGGFSVSNLGMYGIHAFAAIINPPQACILAVGAGEVRPIVRDGQVVPATVMTCTLSIDHRAVDGAVGAEFLAALKLLIEQPYALVV